jgi:predicted extracellular nuclease
MRRGILSILVVILWAVIGGGAKYPEVFVSQQSICQIQGSGLSSPFNGRNVLTNGVVTADFDDSSPKAFYIQEYDCDGNPATSDGVAVYLGERIDLVKPGDYVEVSGEIQEYFGFTEIATNPGMVKVISSGYPLPKPFPLNPPINNDQARVYFESLG